MNGRILRNNVLLKAYLGCDGLNGVAFNVIINIAFNEYEGYHC